VVERVEEYVGWFQVPVEQAAQVGVMHRLGDALD
jgi:hypothetical protein